MSWVSIKLILDMASWGMLWIVLVTYVYLYATILETLRLCILNALHILGMILLADITASTLFEIGFLLFICFPHLRIENEKCYSTCMVYGIMLWYVAYALIHVFPWLLMVIIGSHNGHREGFYSKLHISVTRWGSCTQIGAHSHQSWPKAIFL